MKTILFCIAALLVPARGVNISLISYNVQGLFRSHDFRDQQHRPVVTSYFHKLTDAVMAKASQPLDILIFCFQEIFELSRQTYASEMRRQLKSPVDKAISNYFNTEFVEDNKLLANFKCALLGTNKALATVICFRKDSVTVKHLRNLKYVYNEDELPGHVNQYAGKLFPFKGGLISELMVNNIPFKILNLHLSSKNIENRRSQVTEILQKYYGSENHHPNSIFIMAGDMNSRIGSNYRIDNINPLDYYKGGPILKNFLRGCLEMLDRDVDFAIQGWNRQRCLELIDFVNKYEELTTFFSVPLRVSNGINLLVKEAGVRRFAPTFCFDKNKQYVKKLYVENYTYDCHKLTENTISWPDRIFFVNNKVSYNYGYHADVEAYDSLKLPLSDHMPVYSIFRASEPCLLSSAPTYKDLQL